MEGFSPISTAGITPPNPNPASTASRSRSRMVTTGSGSIHRSTSTPNFNRNASTSTCASPGSHQRQVQREPFVSPETRRLMHTTLEQLLGKKGVKEANIQQILKLLQKDNEEYHQKWEMASEQRDQLQFEKDELITHHKCVLLELEKNTAAKIKKLLEFNHKSMQINQEHCKTILEHEERERNMTAQINSLLEFQASEFAQNDDSGKFVRKMVGKNISLQNQVSEMQKETIEQRTVIQKITGENKALFLETVKLQELNADKDELIRQLTAETQARIADISDLIDQNNAEAEKIISLEKQISDARTEYQEQTRKLSDMLEKITRESQALVQEKAALYGLNLKKDEQLRLLTEEKRVQIEELGNHIRVLTLEKRNRIDDCCNMLAQNKVQMEKIADLEEQLSNAWKSCEQKLKAVKDECVIAIKGHAEKFVQMKKDRDTFKKDCSEMRKFMGPFREQLYLYRAELEMKKRKWDVREFEKLQKEHFLKYSDIIWKEDNVNKLKQITMLNGELRKLRGENQKLYMDLKNAQQKWTDGSIFFKRISYSTSS